MGALTNIKRDLISFLKGNGHQLNENDDDLIREALDRAYGIGIREDPKIRKGILAEKRRTPERRKGERRRV
jgi:hypothetical protein